MGVQRPDLWGQNPYLQGTFFHPNGMISYDPNGHAPLQPSALQQATQWAQQNGQAMANNYGTIIGNNNNNATNNYYNTINQQQATQANPALTKPPDAVSAYGGYWYNAQGQRVGGDGSVPNYNLRPGAGTTAKPVQLSAYGTPTGTQYTQMVGSAYGTGSGTAYTGGTNNPTSTAGILGTLNPYQRTLITDPAQAQQVMSAQKDLALQDFDRQFANSTMGAAYLSNSRQALANSWDKAITGVYSQFWPGYTYIPPGAQQPAPVTSGYGTLNNGGFGTQMTVTPEPELSVTGSIRPSQYVGPGGTVNSPFSPYGVPTGPGGFPYQGSSYGG